MTSGVLCALMFPAWFLGGFWGASRILLFLDFFLLDEILFWLGLIFVPLSPFLFLLGFQPGENTIKWRVGLLCAAGVALAAGVTALILAQDVQIPYPYEHRHITSSVMFGSAVTGPLLALWLLLRRKPEERRYLTILRWLGSTLLLFAAMPHAIFAIIASP